MVKTGGGPERLPAQLSQVNLNAAGIDVGATSHFVAVPADRAEQPVHEFAAFTADLYRLAEWLSECGVETVVMESTGVYWIPLFGVLEERGFAVMLVDPRRIKNVPGRKTDVLDCQWLQQLHTYGLLSGAFRPDGEIRRLRSYLRQRTMLVEYASHHIRHMQKALTHRAIASYRVRHNKRCKVLVSQMSATVYYRLSADASLGYRRNGRSQSSPPVFSSNEIPFPISAGCYSAKLNLDAIALR